LNTTKISMSQVLIILALTVSGGCTSEKDVTVDFHFTPPFSYHSADFKPVSLDIDNATHYNIPSFYKNDKRFRGIRATLLLQHIDPKVETKEVLSTLRQVTISIIIRDKSGAVVLNENVRLDKLQHKRIDSGAIEFGFASGPFTAKEPDKIEINTVTQEPKKNLAGLPITLRLTEIRGK